MRAFFSQLYLRLYASMKWYSRLTFHKKAVRCETCPHWRYHCAMKPAFMAPETVEVLPVPLGVCKKAPASIINQGGIGFGVKLFHPDDWCPLHPFYKPAPALDLPAYVPPVGDVQRDAEGMEPEAFQTPPTLEQAMRLARVLEEQQDGRSENLLK